MVLDNDKHGAIRHHAALDSVGHCFDTLRRQLIENLYRGTGYVGVELKLDFCFVSDLLDLFKAFCGFLGVNHIVGGLTKSKLNRATRRINDIRYVVNIKNFSFIFVYF